MALTREQRLGGALAAGAYFSWGLAPLYFKSLDFLPAAEIVMHRIVWSFALLLTSSFALQGLLQLSTMGFFQYIGPSFMFVFSVWLFGETLAPAKLLTFCCIWVALAVYSADALRHSRGNPGSPEGAEPCHDGPQRQCPEQAGQRIEH